MNKNPALALDSLMTLLTERGYKVLIREYECTLGVMDVIAKRDGVLYFFAFCSPKEGLEKAESRALKIARYYLKRYGISTHYRVGVI